MQMSNKLGRNMSIVIFHCKLAWSLWSWVTVFVIAATALPSLRAEDWPQWRGPNRNGVSSETEWLTSWPEAGPKVLWRKSLGVGFSSVVVRSGRVYTLGSKGDTDFTYCLDADTGREMWLHSYPCPAGPDDPGPRATPALDGNRLYTISRAGHVNCLDANSGKAVWSVYLPDTEELKWDIPRRGLDVSASPLVDGDLLVVNVSCANVALDKVTGKVVWKDNTAQGGFASPVPFRMTDERAIAIFAGARAVGLSARTGQKLWSYEWPNTANAADPSVVGDRLFLSTGYGSGCALFKPARGEPTVLWRNKSLCTHFSSAVVWQGHVYGFSGQAGNKNHVVCLDVETGEEKWRHWGLDMGTLMVAGGRLVMLTEKGNLVIADASPKEYTELARAKVIEGKCWTVPVLSGGRVYCRNHEGELVCLDVRRR